MIEKTIRRFGIWSLVQATLVVLLAMTLVSATTTDAAARKHTSGRHGAAGKVAHSARKTGRHGRHQRFARLSRHHATPQRPLTSAEKEQIVEKIRELAKSSVSDEKPITDNVSVPANLASASSHPSSPDDSVIAAEASSLDIQSQIAEAAKEEQAEDDVDVSIDQFFKMRPGATGAEATGAAMEEALNPALAAERQQDFVLFDENDPNRAAQRSDVMAEIIDWIGTRYQFGGDARSGIDCSAFTREVFDKAFGLELPRTAYMQSQLGDPVGKTDLQFGDLVFFKTARYAPITHVGIYIGEGLFANAACSRGVTVASLESTYWSKRYVGARRIFSSSSMAAKAGSVSTGNMADRLTSDQN